LKAFARLFDALDSTNSTNDKVEAMVEYFRSTPARDAVWALYLLMGRKIKRPISSTAMRELVEEFTGFRDWLVDESYEVVGDLGETIALLIHTTHHPTTTEDISLADWLETRILPLRDQSLELQKEAVFRWWRDLDYRSIFLLNKIMLGSFRVGVSQTLVLRAVAAASDTTVAHVTQCLIGEWQPTSETFLALKDQSLSTDDPSTPFPFALAYPLERPVQEIGPIGEWSIEWKWDGIRAQLIRRGGHTYLWSRGEEMINGSFPDLIKFSEVLPEGTVLDGEILAFTNERPLPFAALQKRLGRKKPGPSLLKDVPVEFVAYDLLESDGIDLREMPLRSRRERLMNLLLSNPVGIRISPEQHASDWQEITDLRQTAREQGVEGLMLKRQDSPYLAGRRKGDWWKWKIEPYTFDGVLIYAQMGHGKRANLFTDYTFAVWDSGKLIPVAKAYSGLSNAEIAELDRWIRTHTKERFGPVRVVEPEHVFELAFEGIAQSPRHKSGIALRFPRIGRWRKDKPIDQADNIKILKDLLHVKA